MNLKTYQWVRMIAEQKKAEGKKDEDLTNEEIKVIEVDRWMPWLPFGHEARKQKVKTSDFGTFEEMYKKYGDSYRYFCAQYPVDHPNEFRLYPNRDKGWEAITKDPEKFFGPANWKRMKDRYTEAELQQRIYSRWSGDDLQLNALKKYSQRTAWIDLELNVILVEHAR